MIYIIIERQADCAGVYAAYASKKKALAEQKRLNKKFGNWYTVDTLELR